MIAIGMRALAGTAVLAMAVACTPALDWREVRLEGLQAMLPCKPDRGERKVPLADHTLPMQMAGCEAQGAMYAISYVRLPTLAAANAVQSAWRHAAMANINGTAIASQPIPIHMRGGNATVELVTAKGSWNDGKALQARFMWVTQNDIIYHVAVFGEKLDNERLDMLLTDLRVQ